MLHVLVSTSMERQIVGHIAVRPARMRVLDMFWHEEGEPMVNSQPWGRLVDQMWGEALYSQRGRPGMHMYTRGQWVAEKSQQKK